MRTKTVFTEIGPVDIDVPRDVKSSFEPQIVKKRQRRLTGIDEIVLSLTAKGLTTGEVAAHFADVYGATVSSVAWWRGWQCSSPTSIATTANGWSSSAAAAWAPT